MQKCNNLVGIITIQQFDQILEALRNIWTQFRAGPRICHTAIAGSFRMLVNFHGHLCALFRVGAKVAEIQRKNSPTGLTSALNIFRSFFTPNIDLDKRHRKGGPHGYDRTNQRT